MRDPEYYVSHPPSAGRRVRIALETRFQEDSGSYRPENSFPGRFWNSTEWSFRCTFFRHGRPLAPASESPWKHVSTAIMSVVGIMRPRRFLSPRATPSASVRIALEAPFQGVSVHGAESANEASGTHEEDSENALQSLLWTFMKLFRDQRKPLVDYSRGQSTDQSTQITNQVDAVDWGSGSMRARTRSRSRFDTHGLRSRFEALPLCDTAVR